MASTFVQHCTDVIQTFCVYWASLKSDVSHQILINIYSKLELLVPVLTGTLSLANCGSYCPGPGAATIVSLG